MQEIQPAPSVTVDPQQYQQFTSTDVALSQSFVSLVPAPHPDPTLPPDSADHMHVTMSAPLFQQQIDPAAALPMSMHIPMGSLPQPADPANAMDVLASAPPQSGSPGIIPDLPTQSALYGMDPRLASLEGVDPSHPLLSSPSATSASTSASHASSPSLTGVTPSFSAGSSSLASALDHIGTTRSRSGSVASPPNLTASGSDMGFPTGGSGPTTTQSGFEFPPPGFENPLQTNGEAVQDVPGGAHLMVLGDMLKKCVWYLAFIGHSLMRPRIVRPCLCRIARTASSGSEACVMGQGGNATEIVSVLKKNVLLVAELVAAMQLGDATAGGSPGQSLGPDSSSSLSASFIPAPVVGAQQSAPQQAHTPPSLNNLPSGGSMDPSTMSDSSESRKRCASSVAGDRVVKSMKLEPQDEAPPVQIPPSTGVPPSLVPATHFSYTYPLSNGPPPLGSVADMSAMPPPMSAASTLSSSRPPSSAGLPAPLSLGMTLDTNAQLVSSIHGSIPGESLPPMPHSPDFIPPPSTASTTMPSPPGFLPSGGVWPDGRVANPRQHRYSLSTGSVLTNGATVTNVVPAAGSSYPAPVYSPTRTTHLQQTPMNAASATLGRGSRSQSISHLHGNPFAHMPDTVPHPTMYESTTQSRPSTSGRHSPQAESPEYEYDDGGRDSDDEGEQNSPGNQYACSGQGLDEPHTKSESSAEGSGNGSARSHAGQRRMSRTSPSNEGGNSSGHGNEVPQEYRADVERIFFEFLNSICSNRTYGASCPPSAPPPPPSVVGPLAEMRVLCAPQWRRPIPRASRSIRRSWPRRCSAWTSRPTSDPSSSGYRPSPTPSWKR